MIRYILASSMCQHPVEIRNIAECSDVNSAIRAASFLGAHCVKTQHGLKISRGNHPDSKLMDCGESATTLRMYVPMGLILRRDFTAIGEGTLLKRSFSDIMLNLKYFNISCDSVQGRLPMQFSGKLQSGNYNFDGSYSSQLLSGLLTALPLLKDNSEIHVKNLVSIPYVRLTLKILQEFGAQIENFEDQIFKISGGCQYNHSDSIINQGDWSSVANLLVAAAIGGSLTVEGIQYPSEQADSVIVDILQRCGVEVNLSEEKIHVKSGPLKAFSFDATHTPDIVPPLVALAVHCEGTTRIRGIERLANKESRRAEALVSAFSSLGAKITLQGNELIIENSRLKGGIVSGFQDHRIIMSVAIAALDADAPVTIDGTEAVSKSYENFFVDLKKIGAHCS